MERIKLMSAVAVCTVGILAMGAVAQDKKPADAGKPATPAKADPKAAAPTGTPSEEEMMKAMMEAATPGPNHTFLQKSVGEWDGKVQMWMDPSQPPQVSNCTTIITPMFEGRFVKSETKGTMDMGGMPMTFEGFGLYGYNNTTKEFESTWVDNMGTMTMHLTGKLSTDGKTLSWISHYTCPVTNQPTTMRQEERITGENTKVLEMYGVAPGATKEAKIMQIDYTRKPGTGKVIGESKGEIKKAEPAKK